MASDEKAIRGEDPIFDRYAAVIVDDKVFPLNRYLTLIGRRKDNHIVIPDRRVSRYHARIIFQQDNYILLSPDPRNGSQLKGWNIFKKVLKSGDSFYIGGYRLYYVENEGAKVTELNRAKGEYAKPRPLLNFITENQRTITLDEYYQRKREAEERAGKDDKR